MSKIIFNARIDVTKLNEERFYKGKKGTYANLSLILDPDQLDQYGNNGMIVEQVSKEEREQGVKGLILGNAKVVWRDEQVQQKPSSGRADPGSSTVSIDDDFDVPF